MTDIAGNMNPMLNDSNNAPKIKRIIIKTNFFLSLKLKKLKTSENTF